MKKTLLTCGLIMAGISLFAQSKHIEDFKKDAKSKHNLLIQNLIKDQMASQGTALKPTGLQQRVIAQTGRDENMAIADSVRFKYSGTRSSRFDYNNEDFSYNTYFGSDYLPTNGYITGGNTMDMLADSIVIDYQSSGDKDISNAYYRADNKTDSFRTVSSYFDGTTTVFDYERTYNKFNSQGYLTQYITTDSTDGSAGYDTGTVAKYYYNTGLNQVLTDTTFFGGMGTLMPVVAQSYHYNTQNKLDTIFVFFNDGTSYDLFQKTAIVYNSANLIQQLKSVSYDGSGTGDMVYTNIDSFGYTGSLPFYTFHQQIEWDDMNVVTSSGRKVKYIGTNNLPDSTMLFEQDNAGIWQHNQTIKYQYNSNNNPTVLTWTNDDGTFAQRYNFYYETFEDNPISIKEINTNKNFNIYPNPFDNKINIDWKNAATQAKISLVNMLGQTIYTSNKSLSAGNNVIDLPVTANGNYILIIQDQKGNTYNQKLTKR